MFHFHHIYCMQTPLQRDASYNSRKSSFWGMSVSLFFFFKFMFCDWAPAEFPNLHNLPEEQSRYSLLSFKSLLKRHLCICCGFISVKMYFRYIYIYYHFYISYSSPLFLLPSHTALFNQILFELVLNVPILAKSSQCFLASSFHSSSLRLSPIRFGRKGTRLQEWEITQISKLLYQRKSWIEFPQPILSSAYLKTWTSPKVKIQGLCNKPFIHSLLTTQTSKREKKQQNRDFPFYNILLDCGEGKLYRQGKHLKVQVRERSHCEKMWMWTHVHLRST